MTLDIAIYFFIGFLIILVLIIVNFNKVSLNTATEVTIKKSLQVFSFAGIECFILKCTFSSHLKFLVVEPELLLIDRYLVQFHAIHECLP